MTALRRLLWLGSMVIKRASPFWRSAIARLEHVGQWLARRWRIAICAAAIGVIGIVHFLPIGFSVSSGAVWVCTKYSKHHAALAPLLTLAAGVAVAGVALMRHFAQTDADRQRHITENFSRATEQLGNDKLEVRLGGIYSLERISKESEDDYWTVMENLTAFVRERTVRTEAERTPQNIQQRVSERAYFLWLEAGRPEECAEDFWAEAVKLESEENPPTDISAVLTVIARRSKRARKRERANNWHFDLHGAVLKGSNLQDVDLEGANLNGVHLEGAILNEAYLERASLRTSREPTFSGRISKKLTSSVRISKVPTSSRPILKELPSRARISKEQASWGRISKVPASSRPIWREPTSKVRILARLQISKKPSLRLWQSFATSRLRY
jgi:hypothetical protein